MQLYTVGFGRAYDQVLLVDKKRGPESVRGKLNGIGGKVEPGESYLAAQRREYLEETGLDIEEDRWAHKVTLNGPDWKVAFFTADLTEKEFNSFRTTTDEPIGSYHTSRLASLNVTPNLRWLVPLCFDPDLQFPIVIEDLKG